MTKTEYIFRYNINQLRKKHGYTYQKIADYMCNDISDIIKQHKINYPFQLRRCFDRLEAYAELYEIESYELLIPPPDIIYPEGLIEDSFYINPESEIREKQLAARQAAAEASSPDP